jgi:cytochrome c556
VKKLELAYIKEANKLQQIARAGDLRAMIAQWGRAADSCQSCHDRYKKN